MKPRAANALGSISRRLSSMIGVIDGDGHAANNWWWNFAKA